ncbi:hypothetical protein LCGC14_1183520 [marine sediment metagenome]|uniref:Uncharacterized protein n=1 Tax=marine sediment metagenome TaxID=412755 RepID=A0A0F9LLJ8_9ZZZZ
MKVKNYNTGKFKLNEQKPINRSDRKLFKHGKFLMSTGVGEKARTDKKFMSFIDRSLRRHIAGAWGEIPPEDAKANQEALMKCYRLVSFYY